MFNQKKNKPQNSNVAIDLHAIADLLVEEYRFMKSYQSAIGRIFTDDVKKYISALNFHDKKLVEILQKLNLNMRIYDGCDYDEGLPLTPLNADEFMATDELIIEQTIEPPITNALTGDIVRVGTVILAKKTIVENNTTSIKPTTDTDSKEDK